MDRKIKADFCLKKKAEKIAEAKQTTSEICQPKVKKFAVKIPHAKQTDSQSKG